ncbi:hypothetical protein [Bradyrhizobium sp. WSM1417]|uniref:hypothetical protein n=1 Tax=Bradyrhizobium sp. WSM1417 TaxID=754500 RepID=UPI000481165C|nr:hypothetical protein [Bradyrhizobium sp. WSM1417]
MSAWQLTQYIGGGFSLVAFVVAAVFYGYREWSRTKAAVVKSAPPSERVEAIATLAEFFRVNIAGLPVERQAEIVLEQLRIKARRDLLFFLSFVFLALICGGVASAAIVFGSPNSTPVVPEWSSKCPDAAAQYAEADATRVSAFNYRATDPGNTHVSNWTRPTPDRWLESANEGETIFAVGKRTHVGICDGTIVTKLDDTGLQLLISDKNCPTRSLMFRRAPSCVWVGLPKMQGVQ